MARLDRRRRTPKPHFDDEPIGLPPSKLSGLRDGTFRHTAEAYAANNQLDIAEGLVRELKPWARRRVVERRFA